jgi:hypothetical protein
MLNSDDVDSPFRAPLAYLITFRCYGNRLHGDRRGSMDRTHHVHGAPRLAPSEPFENSERKQLKHAPVALSLSAMARKTIFQNTLRTRTGQATIDALFVVV